MIQVLEVSCQPFCLCVFDGNGVGGDRMGKLVKTCISKLKHLRILNLSEVTDLEQLPNSTGTLIHLRQLILTNCKRLKRLPNSITKLYNLEALWLEGCEELEELPKDIGDLINLKILYITTEQKRLSAATANGIISLCFLQLLTFADCPNLEYIFESEEDDDDKARPQLTSLQILCLTECKSLMLLFGASTSASAPRKRSCLTSLDSLAISDCPNLDLGCTDNDEISLPCLKQLGLLSLPQIDLLPQWICPPALEFVTIADCPNLVSLPDWLPNLTALRLLIIRECPKVMCLPEGIHCLTALKELKIEDCPELSRRCKKGKGEDWPNIAHIPNLDIESASESEDEDDDEPEIAAASSS